VVGPDVRRLLLTLAASLELPFDDPFILCLYLAVLVCDRGVCIWDSRGFPLGLALLSWSVRLRFEHPVLEVLTDFVAAREGYYCWDFRISCFELGRRLCFGARRLCDVWGGSHLLLSRRFHHFTIRLHIYTAPERTTCRWPGGIDLAADLGRSCSGSISLWTAIEEISFVVASQQLCYFVQDLGGFQCKSAVRSRRLTNHRSFRFESKTVSQVMSTGRVSIAAHVLLDRGHGKAFLESVDRSVSDYWVREEALIRIRKGLWRWRGYLVFMFAFAFFQAWYRLIVPFKQASILARSWF
jgi:hypothetical protein